VFRLLSRWAVALVAILVALVASATANAAAPARSASACVPAPATAQFGASTNRLGVIDLVFRSAPAGSSVTYYECVGTRATPLGTRRATGELFTSLTAATVWRCGRLRRHFAAILTMPDGSSQRGTSSARTKSCARRFTLDLPARVQPGRLARVRVVDRWGIGGIRTRLCLTPPGDRRTCRTITFAAAATVATRRFRMRTRGRWRVELHVRDDRVRGAIAVGGAGADAKPLPKVLATGDSTMQSVDSFLSDDLGDEANVISDVRPGVGLSKGEGWTAVANAQAARVRPTATVVSIGAAEGFPMRDAAGVTRECCDAAWIDEYTRRVRQTMLTYRRGGRGRVYWLTLPAPREANAVGLFNAVNQAILRAAQGMAGVRILRTDELFTPNGYRDVMRYRGRDVRVREPDGIHLNISGAAIAARVVARALRDTTR